MRKAVLRFWVWMILLPMLLSTKVLGGEVKQETAYVENWKEMLDFSELDELFEREQIQFSDVVERLLEQGISDIDYAFVGAWISDTFFYELEMSQKGLMEIIVLAVAFSFLKNFSGAFKQTYISDISFFMVYGILAVLLLQSFQNCGDIAIEALEKSVDFMKTLVPTFCISMVFSSGVGTSAGFYQVAFVVIYLIQWLFLKIFLPLIEGYVLLILFQYFFEDNKFENLTELIGGIVNWGLKTAGVAVIGMNVVQGLIAPAKDRLAGGAVQRMVSYVPGVGSVMNGVGELLLGSGILLKNCVGVAAMLFMIIIALMPVIKILGITLLYKMAAVALEPVADKRIAGCLKGMTEAGMLYFKLVIYCMAFFFVTIALMTAASGVKV